MNPSQKKPSPKWPITLLLALGLSLGVYEGTRYEPYQDIGGVWTVCEGITGQEVIPGKVYTEDECAALMRKAIETHLNGIAQCAPVAGLPAHQQFAHAHIAYNIGVGAWCKSSLARLIRDGQPLAACGRMAMFVYVGGKDCRKRENACFGIVKRRFFERGVCEGTIKVPGLS